MNLSRWDIKRLMRGLDLGADVADYRASLKTFPKTMRAKYKREAALFRALERDLGLLLANWPKNRKIEL